MKRFVIACGGTGGHLAPGIALAQTLQDRGCPSLLLISQKAIDARLRAKYPDLEFAVVPGAPLLFTAGGLTRFVIKQTQGLFFSWRLVRRERPAAIVGFGGFTTASIIVAGWMRGVPVALHEANRVVGRAVRMLARFAERVYLPRGVKLPTAAQSRLRFAGLPVRVEIERVPRGEAAERFGLDPNRPTVVVFGGSQGASALNLWAQKQAAHFALRGVQLLVVTGPDKGEAMTEFLPGPNDASVAWVRLPFCDEMASLYSVGDLVVSRSGAGTLAELVKCRVPAILVPYPHAADNHQVANAQAFARGGGGIWLSEAELDRLTTEVEKLLGDEVRLADMRSQIGYMSRSEALDLMIEDLEVLAGVRLAGNTLAPWQAIKAR
jgi:UDP-N-acetylglucosamine--N-acetylmuramyl-(pentapeptide) pyrophosphoryl-undecaprenol N-acetylglucosamine transferase